jgi:hypothetical protein
MLAALIGLAALTMSQARWGYFLALGMAMALPFAAEIAGRRRMLAAAIWMAGLWPVAAGWDRALFSRETEKAARRSELAALRETARTISGAGGGPILAAWWLSPALAYWTGSPCVAGSSHESLPGIADAARFWIAETEGEAREIVQRRGVRWVVVEDPVRLIDSSEWLLGGGREGEWPMGRLLYERPSQAPPWLEAADAGPRFKLFRVK